jgi:hypothetical protein
MGGDGVRRLVVDVGVVIGLGLVTFGCSGSDDSTSATTVAFAEAPSPSGGDLASVVNASLSPDGTELVYTVDQSALYVAQVPGTGGDATAEGTMIDIAAPVRGPQLLADGRVAGELRDSPGVVAFFDRSGAEVDRVAVPDDADQIVVAPDGGYVYYVVDSFAADSTPGIWRVAVAAGDPESIVEFGDDATGQVSLSADGTRMSYVLTTTDVEVEPVGELFVAAADGAGPVLVGVGAVGPAVFSPTGDSVAYVRDAGTVDGYPTKRVAITSIADPALDDPTYPEPADQLSRSVIVGWLPDGRILHRVDSYGFENVLAVAQVD